LRVAVAALLRVSAPQMWVGVGIGRYLVLPHFSTFQFGTI